MVRIDTGIEIIDLALYLPSYKTIIFSDFHIGYEEMLTQRGIFIPRFQFKDTIKRLDRIFSKLKSKKLKTIVINGDLKHEFGVISTQEWREVLKLIDYFSKKCQKIILVKGNHDVKLGPIARKRNVELVKNYTINNILISHGDGIDAESKDAKTIIIGHDHPAIRLRDKSRTETFKCFLKGKWKRKMLIVQPSFNVLVEGSDVLQEEFLSPYLHQPIRNFEVYVVSEKEILYFGRVKNLKK